MKATKLLISWLIIICVPILILTTVLRWEINDISFYQDGFEKYGISVVTGIDEKQLTDIAQHLVDYFNLKIDSVQYNVSIDGRQLFLFNEREIIHLEDVQNLVQLDYRVQLISFLLMVICTLVLLSRFREKWLLLIKSLFWGSVTTIGFMVFLAFWALIGFERLFVLFHVVSFSNQYWILDPSKDYLIMLFPGGFFYGAALRCFGAVILVSLIIGISSFIVMRLYSSKKR